MEEYYEIDTNGGLFASVFRLFRENQAINTQEVK